MSTPMGLSEGLRDGLELRVSARVLECLRDRLCLRAPEELRDGLKLRPRNRVSEGLRERVDLGI